MYLRTVDGMKLQASQAVDITIASRSATTVTSTGVDTSGHKGFMAVGIVGTVAAGGSAIVKVQESETVGGTYTDVTGATFTFTGAADNDKHCVIHVNTELPARKKFMRISVQNTVNTFIYGAVGYRINPTDGVIALNTGVVAV